LIPLCTGCSIFGRKIGARIIRKMDEMMLIYNFDTSGTTNKAIGAAGCLSRQKLLRW